MRSKGATEDVLSLSYAWSSHERKTEYPSSGVFERTPGWRLARFIGGILVSYIKMRRYLDSRSQGPHLGPRRYGAGRAHKRDI